MRTSLWWLANRNRMRLFDGSWSCRLLLSLLLAVLVLSVGCRVTTKSLFTVCGPGWHVQEGQALWRPGRGSPELGGDLVLASHEDGRCFIEFAKTPLPLITAQTTRTNWLIRFPPRQMEFSGWGRPPARLGWLYLYAALSGEPLPAQWQFQRKPGGGWRLENTRSGESLEGYLSP